MERPHPIPTMVALALVAGPGWSFAQPQAAAPEPAAPAAEPAQDAQLAPTTPLGALVAAASDARGEAADRESASAQLVAQAADAATLTALDRLLRSDPADDATRTLLLDAIARSIRPVEGLWPIVRDLASAPSSVRAAAVGACSAFRTRASARLLVGLLASDQQEAAAAALVAMSGREDLATDPASWRQWLERVEGLDEPAWHQELVGGLGSRGERLVRRTATLRNDLVEAYRRLYLGAAPDSRTPLLAELLRHRQPEVRTLGFDLSQREIGSGTALGEPVLEAAKGLLTNPDAAARAQGAVLLSRLSPEASAGALRAALTRETDPSAADPMLRGVARAPDPGVLPVVLRWLGFDRSTDAASEAAWAFYERGMLTAPEDRAAVLDTLRARPVRSLGPAALRLRASLGDETDLHAVAGLITDERLRAPAADALALRREAVPMLLTAVQLDPSLFSYAARAAGTHDPSVLNVRVLAGVLTGEDPQRVPLLLEVGRRMSSVDLVAVTEHLPESDPLCESLLVLLADPSRAEDQPGARAQGLIRLAEIRVDAGRAEAALSVLPARERFDPSSAEAARIDRVGVVANLLLGRFNDAERIGAPASAWLGALERVASRETIERVIALIERRFADVLTADERRRVETFRARAAAMGDPPPPAGG